MKCFYHPEVDAVAICKNCGKGLCLESAVDLGNGVACKGVCEAEVAALIKVVQQSKLAFSHQSKTYFQYALWMLIFGIGFMVSSRFLVSALEGFLIFAGLAFILGALYTYNAGRRYRA